ncbi:MAG: VWA domain-containing protein [Chloroflexota bacterium]
MIFLQNTLTFTRMLRIAGIPISLDQSVEFAEGLTLIDIGNREQVYYTARALLLNRQENLRLFDTIFNRFWRQVTGQSQRAQPMPIAPRHNVKRQERFDISTYMAFKARQGDQEIELQDKVGTFSDIEILKKRPFSEMMPEELETIKRLISRMKWRMSERETRRRVPKSAGDQLFLRKMMRKSLTTGGTPIQMHYSSRKIKERPLILIADISGSMETYSRLLLQFFYSLAHSLKKVESFVFATRLTRITHQLKIKNIDTAVDQAAREVNDWSGGTRIGESIHIFNHLWSRRVLRRGAVVIIISDGWERGDPTQLKKEMRYLQHRTHRLIWLNPLAGKQTYQPRVEGMMSALPYIDDFLPIHNLQSLEELGDHLGKIQ